MDLILCPSHDYPLKSTNISSKCDVCYEDYHDNKQGYKCNFCDFYVHEECINVKIPSRHKHPLKLTRYERIIDSCDLCESKLNLRYKCSECSSFRICIPCVRKPLIYNEPKVHEHELHQTPIKLSFTCDACGLYKTNYPCICLQCCFIIHYTCIFLPRVIYINLHDHRISYVSSLGIGKWICGVCREKVNGECGAYSCLVCPYVAHSKCATKSKYWDGKELEGIPEEDENEESKPFEVIDQNLIKHFIHEHNLKVSLPSIRHKGDVLTHEEGISCYACTLPLHCGLCYKCTQCDFILHEECANLPRKKRHVVSSLKLILCETIKGKHVKGPYGKDCFGNYFVCGVCERYCTGFSYSNIKANIDVKCASISDTFKHESHPHWLFVYYDLVRCNGCDFPCWFHLRCNGKDDCHGFKLCFKCATLPTSFRHKYDIHPLSLYYGEQNLKSTYCCGICEKDIYYKSWFYGCNDCCTILHIDCVYKNLIHSRLGQSITIHEKGTFDLLPKNHISRPICYLCNNRCMGDLVLKNKADTNAFLCCSCGFPDL